MKIFCKYPTINISKLHFWLVICIAKNFIWTTLRWFSQYFDFFAPSDSRFSNICISAKYCHIITNIHQWKAYLFSFHMMYKSHFFLKMTLMTGFVVHGHIYDCMYLLFHVLIFSFIVFSVIIQVVWVILKSRFVWISVLKYLNVCFIIY